MVTGGGSRCVLGQELGGGRSFVLSMPGDLRQHVTLLGVTGAGKTTTAELLADASAAAGMATLVIDAKGAGLRGITREIAVRHGRQHRELVIPGGDLGYNPCALGSSAQVADKLVSAFTHGPSAEIFRVIAQEVIAILVGVLRALDEPVSVDRLARELDRSRMPGLAHEARECAPELAADLIGVAQRTGVVAEALEGMRARLGALRHGEYGELLSEGRPAFDLGDCLRAASVSYIGLPALAVTKDTALMARVLIQDLKQAAYLRLANHDVAPALLVLDEFAALDDPDQIGDLLRQAREAGIAVVVSTQHLPQAHGLRAALLGAGCIISHRIGPDDARSVAAVIGTEPVQEVTFQMEEGRVTGRTSGRIVDHPRVSASRLSELATGEAVVLLAGGPRRVGEVAVRRGPVAADGPDLALSLGGTVLPPPRLRLEDGVCAVVSALCLRLTFSLLLGAVGLLVLLLTACVDGLLGGAQSGMSTLGLELTAWAAGVLGSTLALPPLVLLVLATAAAAPLHAWAQPRLRALARRGRVRRLSRAEALRLEPLLRRAAAALGCTTPPTLYVAEAAAAVVTLDGDTLVLTPILMRLLDDSLLEAVLAHEVAHVMRGDAAALAVSSGLAWPVTGLAQCRAALLRRRGPLAALLALLLWPSVLLGSMALSALVGGRLRAAEYDCDRRAAAAGYAAELRRALLLLADFDITSGMGDLGVVVAHPPCALRCEALEPSPSAMAV